MRGTLSRIFSYHHLSLLWRSQILLTRIVIYRGRSESELGSLTLWTFLDNLTVWLARRGTSSFVTTWGELGWNFGRVRILLCYRRSYRFHFESFRASTLTFLLTPCCLLHLVLQSEIICKLFSTFMFICGGSRTWIPNRSNSNMTRLGQIRWFMGLIWATYCCTSHITLIWQGWLIAVFGRIWVRILILWAVLEQIDRLVLRILTNLLIELERRSRRGVLVICQVLRIVGTITSVTVSWVIQILNILRHVLGWILIVVRGYSCSISMIRKCGIWCLILSWLGSRRYVGWNMLTLHIVIMVLAVCGGIFCVCVVGLVRRILMIRRNGKV